MARASLRLKWRPERLIKPLQSELERRLKRAAELLKSDIQRSMHKGGGGAVARRAAGRVRRSRPGEVPFVQTGKLRQSIFARRGRQPLSYEVGTNLLYGVYHELGINYPKAGFQQRPFIQPALQRNKRKMRKIVLGS